MLVHRVNHSTYAKVFKMLLQDPATAHEIVEETGLHIVTTQALMRTLKKHSVVHVCAWEADRLGRDVTPVYKLGEGRDKQRRKLSGAERARRYRERRALRLQQAAVQNMVTGVQQYE